MSHEQFYQSLINLKNCQPFHVFNQALTRILMWSLNLIQHKRLKRIKIQPKNLFVCNLCSILYLKFVFSFIPTVFSPESCSKSFASIFILFAAKSAAIPASTEICRSQTGKSFSGIFNRKHIFCLYFFFGLLAWVNLYHTTDP